MFLMSPKLVGVDRYSARSKCVDQCEIRLHEETTSLKASLILDYSFPCVLEPALQKQQKRLSNYGGFKDGSNYGHTWLAVPPKRTIASILLFLNRQVF